MNDPRFSGFSVHHLDPSAQEFIPAGSVSFPAFGPQIVYPYPPMVYDNMGYATPQFPPFAGGVMEPLPPPQQPPPSLPPSSLAPSRALLLSMVPPTVSESTVRRELEIFGDVRAVEMDRRREGLVTVHFYDVRDAQAALVAIQDQHMQQQLRLGRHYEAVLNNSMGFFAVPPPPLPPQTAAGLISGRVVWAQFIAPVTFGLPDGNNQGTLVVFNLDPGIPSSHIRDIFHTFGPIKELRETPNKRNQKFVEFYDVRDAAKAMSEMNDKEIAGKSLVIEFSRPGGQCKKLWKTSGSSSTSKMSSSSCSSPPPPTSRNFSLFRYDKKPPPPRVRRSSCGGNPCKSPSSSLCGSVSKLSIENEEYPLKSSRRGSGGASKQAVAAALRKPWKATTGVKYGKEHHDPSFLINEDAIMESNCRDTRTTVMIKNIPNKYSQKLLLNMLDNHCIHCNEQLAAGGDQDQPLSSYDFVYLPIDFINKCNVGYGFVNMTSPQATLRLYKAFHHQNWEVFNSRKICEVTYARLQGLDALAEHFKNSKFPSDDEEYMPVIFSPPRDGRILSEPVPILGRGSPEDHPPESDDEGRCSDRGQDAKSL